MIGVVGLPRPEAGPCRDIGVAALSPVPFLTCAVSSYADAEGLIVRRETVFKVV